MGRDKRWDDIAEEVVMFSEWWKKHKEKYCIYYQDKEAIAFMAFKAGLEQGEECGFGRGQTNMLEAGYELPRLED